MKLARIPEIYASLVHEVVGENHTDCRKGFSTAEGLPGMGFHSRLTISDLSFAKEIAIRPKQAFARHIRKVVNRGLRK
jgi:hypothetical protein